MTDKKYEIFSACLKEEQGNSFNITVTPITNWMHVLNAARFTQRKELISKEPSIKFKKQIIKAEHSPLRCLLFYIDFYNIPRFVVDHLVRHVHAQPFVSTGRSDVLESNLPREEQKMTDLYNMRLLLNAQEIINISKVRLCNKAEKETRLIWQTVINKLSEIEPLLAGACKPSCIYRNLCPEIKSCGYHRTKDYQESYDKYINNLTVFADEDNKA